jgi:hypothetical protein
MKDQILAKMQILKQVTVASYVIPDGNNYQAICSEINTMIADGIRNQKISFDDYAELHKELIEIMKYVIEVKDKAMKMQKMQSLLN